MFWYDPGNVTQTVLALQECLDLITAIPGDYSPGIGLGFFYKTDWFSFVLTVVL